MLLANPAVIATPPSARHCSELRKYTSTPHPMRNPESWLRNLDRLDVLGRERLVERFQIVRVLVGGPAVSGVHLMLQHGKLVVELDWIIQRVARAAIAYLVQILLHLGELGDDLRRALRDRRVARRLRLLLELFTEGA